MGAVETDLLPCEKSAPAQPDRTKFIGGSDASVILGINPWRTPLQLWQDKTTPRVEKVSPARQRIFDRGHRMEPYVVDLLSEETGLRIARRNERYIDKEHGFLACEIDAEAVTGENIEIKTVSPFKAADWGELGTDAIPVYYTAQAQHGLMITGAAVCVFGVLIGGDDFRVYRVERDDELIAGMRQREVAFWVDHIEPRVPPPIINAEDIARLFPKDLGTAIEANTEALIAYNAIKELSPRLVELEQQLDLHKDTLRIAMGAAARLTLDGRDLASWKSQAAKRLDQAAFKEAHPELFAQFTKTTESRVLRIR